MKGGGTVLFKSTFLKYLTAFAVTLLISFIVLSSIVTTVVRNHVKREREQLLERTGVAIANHVSEMTFTDIESAVSSGVISKSIFPLINSHDDINILILNADATVILTTVGAEQTEFGREPVIPEKEINVSFDNFDEIKTDNGEFLFFSGNARDVFNTRIEMCVSEIRREDICIGYVCSFVSTETENATVETAKRAITSNALWIMLAAIIAIYFITERIVNPLKNMTVAVKKYGKGDFSSRVAVYGKDEIAELALAFNNMADSIEHFEKTRNSFIASIAHDLRTPMTTVSGFIDGINSGAIPPDKQEYYLGVISAEIHRLSRLVSDLLDVSRLDSGEKKFVMTTFDVAEVARIVLISFEQKIEAKGLNVIFETEDDKMPVLADKDAIHQVLYNLCHNAIKFSKEGGKLAISISRVRGKKIRVSVYDEGEGIDREELPFLFDRFYKTDTSRGKDKTGVGLGLYICKTIIDAHSEKIVAESAGLDGAEFWFTLAESEAAAKRRIPHSEN